MKCQILFSRKQITKLSLICWFSPESGKGQMWELSEWKYVFNCTTVLRSSALRKHAYSNIQDISPPKADEISDKTNIFHISAQNIDCRYSLEPPRRGGSNEYPQSMF